MASKSVMPRSAIAAWKRGSARTSSSASISSLTTAMGWMSVRSRHVATLPEPSETTASIVRSASRSRITISASRGGGWTAFAPGENRVLRGFEECDRDEAAPGAERGEPVVSAHDRGRAGDLRLSQRIERMAAVSDSL